MPEPLNSKIISLEEFKTQKRPEDPTHRGTYQPQSNALAVSAQQSSQESIEKRADRKPRYLEEEVHGVQKETLAITKINFLPTKNLREPLDIILERDGEGFIARTLEIALYGYAVDAFEAVSALKYEIENLYDELMEDDNFTEEWLRIKEFLRQRITDR